uniref:MYB binding protein 1a n=1 Tax=Latimeria chalumnae TaxID=7897 RepID=H3BH18_LATCH|nr:PREDICTED: myb-binding protein 1A [Latimeria chalumnae]|eukprot:XP_014352918.1 PREDICTED: myb-binding protein 1A [Latimeria chalumnae]
MAEQDSTTMEETEMDSKRPKVVDARGILKQNRQFLDFFWDIAKPEQETRLKAIEKLLEHLKSSEKEDELKYTLKRLVEGLAATRETARPGFSLALAQVLQSLEAVPLQAVLDQIKEKHDPQKVKKKLQRNALFGNFFGVLALSQSGRLTKTPEAVFEEVLFGALQSDLSSAFSTPEQLHLLLVAVQKFPAVLKPKKLKKLLGSSVIITMENIPKLLEVLKTAAKSVKKDHLLPPVGLDLLHIALKEDAFDLFWKEAVENGLLKDQSGPCSYMCFRLLGNALPLLSLDQIQTVLTGEVMRQYGEHVVSAQLTDRFKFAPEMETFVDSFLETCEDPDKQLLVVTSFSTLTNQGYPVVTSFWKVVRHLQPAVLVKYIDWLKNMFISPDLETCVDFSTKRQKENQEQSNLNQHCVFRMRKWIICRLTSIIENPQVKKEEDLVMDIARFIFFHAFFEVEKQTPDIPETESSPSVPVDEQTRAVIASSFFSLLHHLNCLPVLGDSVEVAALNKKHVQGVTADGNLWIYCIVQYADALLSHAKYVKAIKPFSDEQRETWDRMLQLVEELRKKGKTSQTLETSAFQQLFLLVGLHLFKAPEECLDLMSDLQNCMEKALDKKTAATDQEELEWVEVAVEILLFLLSQPSRFLRQICRSVFGRICPHVTKGALQLILDVFDPEKDGEESAIVVTEETEKKKKKTTPEDQGEEENDSEDSSDEDEDSSEGGEDEEMVEEEKDDDGGGVDDNFRMGLMKVLQAGNALSNEGEDSDEDVDDETMMALDENIAALFAEQQKRIQAKKDEKEKMRKEKILVRDFKIKVLDLIEVFLTKQPESLLVFDIIEPMIGIIEGSMNSGSDQQELDFLRKTADIFRNQLCKAKRYCKNIVEVKEELHHLMERLVKRARKQTDSSVAVYCFSAALYLFRVLKGNVSDTIMQPVSKSKKKHKGEGTAAVQMDQSATLGSLDINKVTAVYQEALTEFMTKRKSALTGAMFIDLFNRFPIMCVHLLESSVQFISNGVRQHQQGQACSLVLKALQTRELRLSVTDAEWESLLKRVIGQVTESLKTVTEFKVKVDQEKVIKCLELINFLIKTVSKQNLNVEMTGLVLALQSLGQLEGFDKFVHLNSIYWNAMKHLGFTRPKKEKAKPPVVTPQDASGPKKKKKGFLPETKKRKNWKKKGGAEQGKENKTGEINSKPSSGEVQQGKKRKNKKKRKQGSSGEKNGTEQNLPAKKAKIEPASSKKGSKSHKQEKVKKKKVAKKVKGALGE